MSHVKASGSVRQHSQGSRHGKRLGLKKYGGQQIKPGQIIVRQRGAKIKGGQGVGMGKDHTLFALSSGMLEFTKRLGKTVVNIRPV